MIFKKINNIFLLIIIICSTSLYKFSFLGPLQKGIDLLGSCLIIFLLSLHTVYSKRKTINHNFLVPILFIFFSLLTSMIMAKYSRNQNFSQTLFAQRAIYYYFLYFLLHQMDIKVKDIERIFFALAFVYVILYLIQFLIYPKIIFNVLIMGHRGTVRIYLPGSDYMAIAYFMSIQAFFRTNKIKYLLYILLFFLIFILLGSRLTTVIMTFCLVLFLLFSKKVKSRFLIGFLIITAVVLVFFMFQNILGQLIIQGQRDTSKGEDYIRILAARFYLTDFYKTPLAYITGNGMYYSHSRYGREIGNIILSKGFYLGDLGIIGNYVLYGAFFVIGVFMICYKALKIKISEQFTYIKYMFIAIILALILGGGFAISDFICFIVLLLYILDVSHNNTNLKNNTFTRF